MFILALASNAAAWPVKVRLPWAATSGVHFVEAIVEANNYRAAAAGLALRKSSSPELREFARTLWLDTLADRRRLSWTLTRWRPYAFLPDRVSPRLMFVIDELILPGGDEFDARYIAQQEASLKKVLELAESYSKIGDDFDLKEYTQRSLPKIRMRLDETGEIGMRLQETLSRQMLAHE